MSDPTRTSPGDLPALQPARPVTLPETSSRDFTSRINGRDLRLFLHIPAVDPPAEGFPVFYIFDGNSCFATVAEIMRSRAPADGVRPAVVVAIGYATDDRTVAGIQRMKDLSTPATAEWLKTLPFDIPGLVTEATGGLDDFLRVLLEEIRPLVATLAPTDPADQTVMGHSLGGLAVLRLLFTRPDAFRTFVASSPSIWWSDRGILAGEAAFGARVAAGEVAPRILIDVGEREQAPEVGALRLYRSYAKAQASADFCGMVANARALGERLGALTGAEGYEARTVVFPDEGHISVLPAAISRGLQFALGEDIPTEGMEA